VVFTLPEELNQVALEKPKEYYNTLFKVAWGVVKDFAFNPKFLGAKTGMIAILHTWGQNLSLHPHLHCIVPGGGLAKTGQWKTTKSAGKYLFPVKAMSHVFRARFVTELAKQVALDYWVRKTLFTKKWVIYAKQPFFGPKQVIEYLGRYTHKIAISNQRIKSLDGHTITFSMKDYRHGGKKIEMTLDQTEFIRRFALHILPKGFTRIRHYGIISSTSKKKIKALVDTQIGQVKVIVKAILKHGICPACRQGELETIYRFDQRGPPSNWKELLQA
jgi:hypothetical protein